MSETELSVRESSKVAKFDPKKTKERDSILSGVITYAQQIKDWPLLDKAIAAKIKEQTQFVKWWRNTITGKWGKGKRGIKFPPQETLFRKVERETGIRSVQVSKWEKRLEQPERYAESLRQPSYNKMWGAVDDSRRGEVRRSWPEMIKGEFFLICADPPWQYDFSTSEQREIENQYPTMTIDEIKSLEVPAANDCVLFLWATSPKLADSIEVIQAWGFTYKTSAVWVKDRIGPGYYFRQQHEFLLVATKGSPPLSVRSSRPSSVIESPRGSHSMKPAKAYEALEAMYPELNKTNRVELFCREPRRDWSYWPENEYGWRSTKN